MEQECVGGNLTLRCYIASVLQVLVSMPSIQQSFYTNHQAHIESCHNTAGDCFKCQMGKIVDGALSGKYSNESHTSGINPAMFKSIVGKGHAEFQSMRQQVLYFSNEGRPRILSTPAVIY